MNPPDQGDRVTTIAEDDRRGASELARAALEAIAEACEQGSPDPAGVDQAMELAARLSGCRPAMAPLRNLTVDWLEQMSACREQPAAWLKTGAHRARQLVQDSRDAISRIAVHTLAHLASRATLMTHSHSSTIRGLAEAASGRGRYFHWLVTRSEPGHEGLDLAMALARLGHSVAVLTEAQIPLLMPQADVVVVGADAVLATGELVNKVGTHLLALAAAEQKRPFLCLCESFKFSDLDRFEPEPHDPGELRLPRQPGITGFNFTFDSTPPRLVSGWITEAGMQINRSAVNPWE